MARIVTFDLVGLSNIKSLNISRSQDNPGELDALTVLNITSDDPDVTLPVSFTFEITPSDKSAVMSFINNTVIPNANTEYGL